MIFISRKICTICLRLNGINEIFHVHRKSMSVLMFNKTNCINGLFYEIKFYISRFEEVKKNAAEY